MNVNIVVPTKAAAKILGAVACFIAGFGFHYEYTSPADPWAGCCLLIVGGILFVSGMFGKD